VKGPNPRSEPETASAEGLIVDPSSLKAGDRVVYPNQGVCKVTGVEVQEIAGQKLELVRMAREEDGATVLVPKNKFASIGVRRLASRAYVEGVFHYLAAQYDDPELDWKIRHRDNADRLITGGVLGVAEVVKGLHALSRIRPLPTKEREQYDNARHLLVAELSAALGVSPGVAEDYVDYALMPPAGVKFQLKPPPKPVTLPVRMRRKPMAKSEDDLGLDDLGIELGELPELGEAAEEGEKAEGEGAGGAEAPAAEGAGLEEGGGEGESEDEEALPPPKAAKAKEKVPAKKEKPPEKAPARKAEKPAAKKEKAKEKAPARKPEKPAAKAKAKKPARGGKK
jgi:RNA polymerase-interacting CarD/CdnL/TRCF family regulator